MNKFLLGSKRNKRNIFLLFYYPLLHPPVSLSHLLTQTLTIFFSLFLFLSPLILRPLAYTPPPPPLIPQALIWKLGKMLQPMSGGNFALTDRTTWNSLCFQFCYTSLPGHDLLSRAESIQSMLFYSFLNPSRTPEPPKPWTADVFYLYLHLSLA